MDVAMAFPSVARGCLLQKMRNMDLDVSLVGWVDTFMPDRRMSTDKMEEMEVTTGLTRDP